MMNRKLKNVGSNSHDAYGPEPKQMSLFPEEKPGKNLEQMRIKNLLKAYYKSTVNSTSVEQLD